MTCKVAKFLLFLEVERIEDKYKTKDELIEELVKLRRRIAD